MMVGAVLLSYSEKHYSPHSKKFFRIICAAVSSTAVLRTGNTYDFCTSPGQTSERGKTGCELGLQTYTTPIWQDMQE